MKNKKRKTITKNTERFLIHRLVDNFQVNIKNFIYTRIDLDSPHRVFGSGYDLFLMYKNRSIHIEAKRSLEKSCKDINKLIRSAQYICCNEILLSKSNYYVIEFIVPKLNENYKASEWVKEGFLEIQIYRAELKKSDIVFTKITKKPMTESLKFMGFTVTFFKTVLGV